MSAHGVSFFTKQIVIEGLTPPCSGHNVFSFRTRTCGLFPLVVLCFPPHFRGMTRFSLTIGLEATVAGELLSLSGDLTANDGAVLEQWLRDQPEISALDLAEFDIEDGVAATHAVNAVRLLCSRVSVLRIVAAPQVLAHNLYRTGMLEAGGIELTLTREDEAYG